MPQHVPASQRQWWYACVVATSVAAMVFLPEAFLVDALPLEIASGAAGISADSIACTDDEDFLFNNRRGKNCRWVGARRREKRCGKRSRQGEKIETRCRKTCDYQGCDVRFELTVGAYYYPWWGSDFHVGGGKQLYLRKVLDPPQIPLLGEYDDRNPAVIGKHLDWSRKHNINLWVASWWGPNRREDDTIKKVILPHEKIRDHKVAIFYETTGRLLGENRDGTAKPLNQSQFDLEYLCREYFNHTNYYRMGVDEFGNANAGSATTRPVLFVYLTRKLEDEGMLEEVLSLMRQGARNEGCGEIFIVGDQVFGGPPQPSDAELIPLRELNAVTNYDVYGSMRGPDLNGYVGSREKVTEYYQEQNEWKNIARDNNCSYIPGVSPGFNDRGVRLDRNRQPLSRKLNSTAAEGSLFRAALEEARTIVDPTIGNLIMVNSFNEHHEDTQIEPVLRPKDDARGPTTSTNQPLNRTIGLEYEAYGKLYLEIVKELTKDWEPPAPSAPARASSGPSLSLPSEGFPVISASSMVAMVRMSKEEGLMTVSDINWEEE